MAKKTKKKKDTKGSDAADAVEAVRSAVERTFQATTEGAAGTQKRTRALVDEVAHAAARIRETIEDLRVLEDVRGLRAEIEGLARRVAALEIRDGKRAPAASAPSRPAPAKRTATAKRSTAKRTPAKRGSKPAAAKTRAKPRAKPRAKTARAKPASRSSAQRPS
jgi:hypothetical protein